MPILHLDEWLGRCPNGAAFGPCATRGFGYPGMTVGPLGTRGSKQVCSDMKNALAPMRETRSVGIAHCALRYF
jgi:hypothetical protein